MLLFMCRYWIDSMKPSDRAGGTTHADLILRRRVAPSRRMAARTAVACGHPSRRLLRKLLRMRFIGTGDGRYSVATHERIEINPEVMGGKPVVRGTRVPVEIVLRKLGAGMTPQAIIEDHPRLTPDDIQAAQACPPHHIR